VRPSAHPRRAGKSAELVYLSALLAWKKDMNFEQSQVRRAQRNGAKRLRKRVQRACSAPFVSLCLCVCV
jgi:ABC-type microcin C transport system duplicated ATPase subunit YejF